MRARGEASDESSAWLGTGEPDRHAVRNVGLQDLTPLLNFFFAPKSIIGIRISRGFLFS
jgi:hypothetical protein